MDLKGLLQRVLYSKWVPQRDIADGYSIIIPIPEDMPFLALLAMEGLRSINTEHCGQIIIVGDGHGTDNGKVLRETVSQFNDPRIELVLFSNLDRSVIRRMTSPHWLTIVYGTNQSRCSYAFLHDSDAFFLENDCIERTYDYCKKNRLYTTGVNARWDNFFKTIGYQIPGTWQMMFSVPWLRGHKPWMVRGRRLATPHGVNEFDTLLYPQYLDYGSGKVGVMPNPPMYSHFNGTIVTYRAWRRVMEKPVVDELFRLLLLSILERVVPSTDSKRLLPDVDVLARGLKGADCLIRYDTKNCVRNYREFRDQMSELCRSPTFAGERTAAINSMLIPFDEHFAKIGLEIDDMQGESKRKLRRNGLA